MKDLIDFQTPETDFGLETSPSQFGVEAMGLVGIREDADDHSTLEAPRHKVIVNQNNMQIVGVVGSKYKLVPNSEFFQTVEDTIREAIPENLLVGAQVRDRMRADGSWSQREYVLPEFKEALRGSEHETEVGLRIIANNSYDGGSSAQIICGLIDFYCTNGMILGRDIAKVRARHSSRMTPKSLVQPMLDSLTAATSRVDDLRQMLSSPITEMQVVATLEKNFSGKRAVELHARYEQERIERGQNVFALYSALTHYASHDDYNSRSEETDWSNMHARELEVEAVAESADFRVLYQDAV